MFSGEESYGRYLDLNANHTQYNNLKGLPRHVPYIAYLDILAKAKALKPGEYLTVMEVWSLLETHGINPKRALLYNKVCSL